MWSVITRTFFQKLLGSTFVMNLSTGLASSPTIEILCSIRRCTCLPSRFPTFESFCAPQPCFHAFFDRHYEPSASNVVACTPSLDHGNQNRKSPTFRRCAHRIVEQQLERSRLRYDTILSKRNFTLAAAPRRTDFRPLDQHLRSQRGRRGRKGMTWRGETKCT